jgi:hypothetical protein
MVSLDQNGAAKLNSLLTRDAYNNVTSEKKNELKNTKYINETYIVRSLSIWQRFRPLYSPFQNSVFLTSDRAGLKNPKTSKKYVLGFLKVGSHEGDRRIPLVLIFVPGYGRFYGTKYF